MSRIGIDVGGTHTDAVLVKDGRVLASVKKATTADVLSGVKASLDSLVAQTGNALGDVEAVMIGTTHFTNAVVQRRDLARIGALRIGLPSSASLEPMIDWPEDLRQVVDPMIFMVAGGHEYDGRPIVPLDEAAVRDAARQIGDSGIQAMGISAVFSPLNAECEVRAAEIVREVCPQMHITLSSSLGRIGLLERENVTLLNACLGKLGESTVAALETALREAGLRVPLYLTQNDGTVMRAEEASRFPVYSFGSGPTNSMRGAALMSGLSDAMVIDVGGTTSDIGFLVNGFPRQANNVVEVGGVRTLFRMPDLLSLALGGGTIVSAGGATIGPRSVGYRLPQEALVFGGETLTLTDVAVAAATVEIGDKDRVSHLPRDLVQLVTEKLSHVLEEGIDRMKTSAEDVDLIVVGGGAFLVSDTLQGVSRVHRVPNGGVANAVGAAVAQVSGEVDQIFNGLSRDHAISQARDIAFARAVEAGADESSIGVVEMEDLPIAYLPGSALRVRVRVVGDIASTGHGSP